MIGLLLATLMYVAEGRYVAECCNPAAIPDLSALRANAYTVAETEAKKEIAAWINQEAYATNSVGYDKDENGKDRKTAKSSFRSKVDLTDLVAEVIEVKESLEKGYYKLSLRMVWDEDRQDCYESTCRAEIDEADDWEQELKEHLASSRFDYLPKANIFFDSNGFAHVYACALTKLDDGKLSNRALLYSDNLIAARLQLAVEGIGFSEETLKVEKVTSGKSTNIDKSRSLSARREARGQRIASTIILEKKAKNFLSQEDELLTVAAVRGMPISKRNSKKNTGRLNYE